MNVSLRKKITDTGRGLLYWVLNCVWQIINRWRNQIKSYLVIRNVPHCCSLLKAGQSSSLGRKQLSETVKIKFKLYTFNWVKIELEKLSDSWFMVWGFFFPSKACLFWHSLINRSCTSKSAAMSLCSHWKQWCQRLFDATFWWLRKHSCAANNPMLRNVAYPVNLWKIEDIFWEYIS